MHCILVVQKFEQFRNLTFCQILAIYFMLGSTTCFLPWLQVNFNAWALPFIVHDTLKVVVAHYSASQLITQRETVSQEIRGLLARKAASFNISPDDVSITCLTFGREFTVAIEAKQIAAQEAEIAIFVVEKAK
ncbi:unnamed protein product [Coffea canephora]|uniref:Prohibitin n=1 Tax=Coffea canephora TaxID=49390 RepID=A0A068UY19_COFCA|nr:unnamed protein product [Coffea canephora]